MNKKNKEKNTRKNKKNKEKKKQGKRNNESKNQTRSDCSQEESLKTKWDRLPRQSPEVVKNRDASCKALAWSGLACLANIISNYM